MKANGGIRDYAIEQMNRLLTALASQVQRTAQKPGPDEIHDLRVSIRRFSQGLQLFSEVFPKQQVKKIRGMLKNLMRMSSAIRDRDITLQFLKEAGHEPHQPRLEKERVTQQRQFSQTLRRWSASNFADRWRGGLELDT
jgi:CHAD domain-containing protein